MGVNLLVALPSFGHGGCEYNALTVSMFFQRWFLDDITVFIPEGGDTDFIRTTARKLGLRIESIPVDIKRDVEASAFADQVQELAAFLRQHKPDAVFVNLPWFLYGTSLPVAAHRVGIPALVKFALVPEGIAFPEHTLTPLRGAISGRQVWYTNSAANSGLLATALGVEAGSIDHMHVAPMGTRYIVGQRRRCDLRREIGAHARTAIIICVSRIEHQKGVDVLLSAASPLLRAFDARLVFVGEGGFAGTLAKEVDRLDLAHHVHLLGFRTDVAQLLAQADIFAMPTRFEGGTSQSLLEACEAGLPVVATTLPAIRDLLGGVEGAFLVPIDNMEATRLALRELLSTPPRKRRTIGRKVKAAAAELNVDAIVASTRRRLARIVPEASLQRVSVARRVWHGWRVRGGKS